MNVGFAPPPGAINVAATPIRMPDYFVNSHNRALRSTQMDGDPLNWLYCFPIVLQHFLRVSLLCTRPPGGFRKHAHQQQGGQQRPETEGKVLLQERAIDLPLYQGREHSGSNADGHRLQQQISAAHGSGTPCGCHARFRRAQVSEYAHKKPEEKHEKHDKCQQAKDSYAYPYMQKDIVGMRQVGLIHKAGWTVGDRIREYPVVLETRDVADRVPAVVTQPVVHTIAKPGAIVNHLQGGLPEIEALRRGADALRIDMIIKEEGDDTCMEEGEDESGDYNKEYRSH